MTTNNVSSFKEITEKQFSLIGNNIKQNPIFPPQISALYFLGSSMLIGAG